MARGGFRVGAGRPKGSKKNRTTTKSKQSDSIITRPGESLTPLQFMLRVLNDPNADKELRAKMAIAAAPYIHSRAGEGKKNDRADRAKKAGAGKFGQGKPPLQVIR